MGRQRALFEKRAQPGRARRSPQTGAEDQERRQKRRAKQQAGDVRIPVRRPALSRRLSMVRFFSFMISTPHSSSWVWPVERAQRLPVLRREHLPGTAFGVLAGIGVADGTAAPPSSVSDQ